MSYLEFKSYYFLNQKFLIFTVSQELFLYTIRFLSNYPILYNDLNALMMLLIDWKAERSRIAAVQPQRLLQSLLLQPQRFA